MKAILTVAALAAFVSGCAQVQQATDSAVDAKRQANDLQVRIWLLESCDLSLAGVRRADMDPAFRKALLNMCLGEASPNE